MVEDFYSLLGVEPDASEDAILRAYRERVADEHPDVSDVPDAKERVQRLNRARSVLGDEERRREYDRLGHDAFVERERSGDESPRSRPRPEWRETARSGTRVEAGGDRRWPGGLTTILESLFGFGTARWSSGRYGASAARQSRPQHDRRDPLTVDLEWAFGGRDPSESPRSGPGSVHRTTSPESDAIECPKCRGRGSFEHLIDTGYRQQYRTESCESCGGRGYVPE